MDGAYHTSFTHVRSSGIRLTFGKEDDSWAELNFWAPLWGSWERRLERNGVLLCEKLRVRGLQGQHRIGSKALSMGKK